LLYSQHISGGLESRQDNTGAKISNPSDFSDYRPIAILSCLSKAFEVCMRRSQMVEHLMLNKLLDPLQSGFKPNNSTETALLKVVDDVSRAADLKCGSVLTLLDFSKAFNSIDHELLPIKLSNYFNFSSSAISMIRAYLTGRSQGVCVDGVASDSAHITSGVPQGLVLGPLLICLFMNAILEVMRHCKYHIYVDDVQLYISGRYDVMADCVARLNDDLARIHGWSMSNGLLLNPNKTMAMLSLLGGSCSATCGCCGCDYSLFE
jgi:hypothetical protein